jgi:hypothetical protein
MDKLPIDVLTNICEFINTNDVVNLLKVNNNTNMIRSKNIFKHHVFRYTMNLHSRILIDELKMTTLIMEDDYIIYLPLISPALRTLTIKKTKNTKKKYFLHYNNYKLYKIFPSNLAKLPKNIETLELYLNELITRLTNIPKSIKYLILHMSKIKYFPIIPNHIIKLSIFNLKKTSNLIVLPNSVKTLTLYNSNDIDLSHLKNICIVNSDMG